MSGERRGGLLTALGMLLTGSALIMTGSPILGGPSAGVVSPLVRLILGAICLAFAVGTAIYTVTKQS